MEYDVSVQEHAEIISDARLAIENLVEILPAVAARDFLEDPLPIDEEETPTAKRGPGRPRKVK